MNWKQQFYSTLGRKLSEPIKVTGCKKSQDDYIAGAGNEFNFHYAEFALPQTFNGKTLFVNRMESQYVHQFMMVLMI